jgi:transcriptional regulator with XRE-family HTH domain
MSKREYLPTKTYAKLTSGQVLRIMRELQDMSQVELAHASGVSQTAVSALERDRETLGLDRAKTLALALRIHPAVLLFPDLAPRANAPTPPLLPSRASVASKRNDDEDDEHDRGEEPQASHTRARSPHRTSARRKTA